MDHHRPGVSRGRPVREARFPYFLCPGHLAARRL